MAAGSASCRNLCTQTNFDLWASLVADNFTRLRSRHKFPVWAQTEFQANSTFHNLLTIFRPTTNKNNDGVPAAPFSVLCVSVVVASQSRVNQHQFRGLGGASPNQELYPVATRSRESRNTREEEHYFGFMLLLFSLPTAPLLPNE